MSNITPAIEAVRALEFDFEVTLVGRATSLNLVLS